MTPNRCGHRLGLARSNLIIQGRYWLAIGWLLHDRSHYPTWRGHTITYAAGRMHGDCITLRSHPVQTLPLSLRHRNFQHPVLGFSMASSQSAHDSRQAEAGVLVRFSHSEFEYLRAMDKFQEVHMHGMCVSLSPVTSFVY